MKKLLLLFFTIFCIGYFNSAIAMKSFKQRFKNCNWKAAALGTFAGGCTLANYGLAFSPFFLGSLAAYKQDKEIDNIEDVSPEVNAYVRKQLLNCGYKNQEKLFVKKGNSYTSVSTLSHDYIFIPRYEEGKIKENLKRDWLPHCIQNILYRKRPYKELEQSSAIIQHEKSHLINKDSLRIIVANFIIPCLIQTICIVSKKTFIKPIENYWIKNVLKIPSGLIKASFALIGTASYYRYTEQEADDGINEDIKTLKALKRDLKNSIGSFYRNDNFLFIFSTHPSHGERIERLQERINTLKLERLLAKIKKQEVK
jgi:hypothetical protein